MLWVVLTGGMALSYAVSRSLDAGVLLLLPEWCLTHATRRSRMTCPERTLNEAMMGAAQMVSDDCLSSRSTDSPEVPVLARLSVTGIGQTRASPSNGDAGLAGSWSLMPQLSLVWYSGRRHAEVCALAV